MRQSLENHIAIFRAVAVPAKRSHGEGMRRIVGKGESAVRCQAWILGIWQPPASRFDQAGELRAIWRLSLELADLLQVLQVLQIFLWGRHVRRLSE